MLMMIRPHLYLGNNQLKRSVKYVVFRATRSLVQKQTILGVLVSPGREHLAGVYRLMNFDALLWAS